MLYSLHYYYFIFLFKKTIDSVSFSLYNVYFVLVLSNFILTLFSEKNGNNNRQVNYI